MKKRFLLILAMLLVLTVARAAYFEFLPYTVKQPDGKEINCFVSGDEFFNWIHDKDGYTIIQAPNGYFYYAVISADTLVPSQYLLNSVDPAGVGLKKWAKISKKEYQRRQDVMYAYSKSGMDGPGNAPVAGPMNNLVIYIRFADDSEFTTTRQTYDDKFNPSTGVSVKSYYKEVSYDMLTISSTHYPACDLTTNLSFRDINNRNYYQPYNETTNPNGYKNDAEKATREHSLLFNAINWININSPVSPSLNIDADGDNRVDNVCFIIRGGNGAWNDLLWAHRWSLYSYTAYMQGKRVYSYTFQPETQVSVKTLCHEMFHSLGAPDLYHYTNQGVITPCGSWDIMDGGSGHMLNYMKWKYSFKVWITTIPQITSTGTYTLNPSTATTNNTYRIPSPNSTDEYYVVEYRNKTGTFEGNLPGSGLIVYRIDTRVTGNSNGPPDEVYVYRPGGTTTVNGTQTQAFYSATVGRTAINDATNPGGFLQNGSPGGLKISNITTAGATISFDVTFPVAPEAPANVTITDVYQTTFTAKWTASATASGYRIDISTNPGFTSFVPGFQDKDVANITTYYGSGLNPKTQYYFRVRAYNLGGTSPSSAVVPFMTLSTPSSVPAGMSAVSCNDLVTLKWEQSFGPDFLRYRIYSRFASGPFVKTDSTTNGVSETTRVITGLTRGDQWAFRVTSVNYDGAESFYSDIKDVIIKTGIIPRIKTKWDDVLICYNVGDSIKTFQWYNGGNLIPDETGQFFKTDKIAGSYHVETIDYDGCNNSSQLQAMPGSGTKSVTVYPNPVSGSFSLEIDDEPVGKMVISIFNAYGTRVTEIQSEKTGKKIVKEIPVTNLPDGIYTVRISINKNSFYNTQIVVAGR